MISDLMRTEISHIAAAQGMSCVAEKDGLIIKTGEFQIYLSRIGTSYAVRCHSETIFDSICQAYGKIHQQREKLTFIVAQEDVKELVLVFVQCVMQEFAADAVFDDPNVDSIESTESEARIKLRKGQAWLRTRAMIYWNNSCALTGVTTSEILETCHIKPWSDQHTTARERLSVENTIVMCIHFHRLFDAGLISFADDGALLISPKLSAENASRLGLTSNMRIIQKLETKQKEFLDYHRKNIYQS